MKFLPYPIGTRRACPQFFASRKSRKRQNENKNCINFTEYVNLLGHVIITKKV